MFPPSVTRTITRTITTSRPHVKVLSRGGQNLTDRYLRLEKALRGKEAYVEQTTELSELTTTPAPVVRVQENFHGFPVPQMPKPPADDECCMSGCAICVYDLHEDALDTYEDAMKNLRSSLSALGIPEHEWPQSIRPSTSSGPAPPPARQVINDAFEEMERALAAKRRKL